MESNQKSTKSGTNYGRLFIVLLLLVSFAGGTVYIVSFLRCPPICTGQILTNRDFRSKSLNEAKFSNALLKGADFTSASLENADFSGADLSGATFNGASLVGADFSGATLIGADFTGEILPPRRWIWRI